MREKRNGEKEKEGKAPEVMFVDHSINTCKDGGWWEHLRRLSLVASLQLLIVVAMTLMGREGSKGKGGDGRRKDGKEEGERSREDG